MVFTSPNVDFDESSISHHATDAEQNLEDLSEALDIEKAAHTEETLTSEEEVGVQYTNGGVNELESDEEILRPMATEDESVPDGPDPVVPLIPMEPEAPPHHYRCSEVEHLADAAGPPPTHERRRPRAAISTTRELSADGNASDHQASVGVMEIEENITENTRKHAYHEALLAAENTNLHNEPLDVKEA